MSVLGCSNNDLKRSILIFQPIAPTHLVLRVHISFVFEQRLCYFEILILDCTKKRRPTLLRMREAMLRASLKSDYYAEGDESEFWYGVLRHV